MPEELTNEEKNEQPIESVIPHTHNGSDSPLLGPFFTRDIMLHTQGHVRGGQSAYDTGKGFFLGFHPSSETYRFSIGDADGDKVTWDGTDLTISSPSVGIRLTLPFSELTELNSAATGGSGNKDNFEWQLDVDAGAASQGGLRTDANKADATKDFIFETQVDLVQLTNAAGGIIGLKGSTGITTGTSLPNQSGAMTEDHAGFIFNDDGGGDELYASVSDGTTQNKEQITGITLTNFNTYRVERIGNDIKFSINGTLQKTLTSNLPDDTTNIVCWMGFGNLIWNVKQKWFYQEKL